MKTLYYSALVLLVFTFQSVHAQNEASNLKKVESYFQLNGVHTSFQDIKYSAVRFNGYGIGFEVGRKVAVEKKKFNYGLSFSYSNSKPSTYELNPDVIEIFGKVGVAREFRPSLYFKYDKILNYHFSVGGRVDVIDGYLRLTREGSNNKVFYNLGSSLFARGSYRFKISENLKVESNLEFGLIGFTRESTGFAFNAPQVVTESGSFDYQDNAVLNPFGLKYYQLRPFWNFGNVNIITSIKFKSRWALSYQWHMRKYATIKGYSTTIGIHNLGVKFNFISKEKERRKNNK